MRKMRTVNPQATNIDSATNTPWKQALTREILRENAGGRSFAAGKAYFEDGHVLDLQVTAQAITAKVQGTERYQVRLDLEDDGDFVYDCSCPYANEGNFCKHCVAVGLAWLDSSFGEAATVSGPNSLQTYLDTLEKEQLVSLLLREANRDADLNNRLLLQAAQSTLRGTDMSAYKKSIDRAFRIQGYLDYDDRDGYVDDGEEIVVSLRELLEDGLASETRQLAEYAIQKLEKVTDQIDDSNGEVGGIWQDLHMLHRDATLQLPPDADVLAQWLLRREMQRDWDVDVDWQEYRPALGADGERFFRQLVEAEWRKVPVLQPGERNSSDGSRSAITRLMLSFAADDVTQILAIKQRDLSSSHNFLEIAELYLAAKQPETSMDWAERGKACFSGEINSRLFDFLIEQYTQRERYEEAYDILWNRFEKNPALEPYREVRTYAEAQDEWDYWRERCWAFLRAFVDERNEPPPQVGVPLWYARPRDHSEMVRILLWEGRSNEAWDEAPSGGCSADLWLRLADERSVSHPEDALHVYQQHIEKGVAPTTNGDYSEPMRYLLKVRDVILSTFWINATSRNSTVTSDAYNCSLRSRLRTSATLAGLCSHRLMHFDVLIG